MINYSTVPNEIITRCYDSAFTLSEIRVLFYIIRYTIGFHQHELITNYTILGNRLNMKASKVKDCLIALQEKKILTLTKKHRYSIILSINRKFI